MFQKVLNNTNFYFDESFPPQLLTTLNLKIWCKIPVPSIITPSARLQLIYGELRYLKQVWENYRFRRNSGDNAPAKRCVCVCVWGGGGGLVCVIMKIDMWLTPKVFNCCRVILIWFQETWNELKRSSDRYSIWFFFKDFQSKFEQICSFLRIY